MAQIITTVGIDVSKAWLDTALWPDETVTLHIERDQADCFDTAAAWLTEHGVGRIGLEASGGYEIAVMDAPQAHGFDVDRFNAHRIRLFARSTGRLAKNDRADAAVIAQATAVLRVKRPKSRPRPLDPLVELLNYRRRLCDWIVDCANQLEHVKEQVLSRQTQRRQASLARDQAAIEKKLPARLAARPDWNELAQLGTLSRRQIASLAGVASFDDDSGQRRGELDPLHRGTPSSRSMRRTVPLPGRGSDRSLASPSRTNHSHGDASPTRPSLGSKIGCAN